MGQVACAWSKGKKCVGDIAKYDEPCGKIRVEDDPYECAQQIACKVIETTGSCGGRQGDRANGCAKQSEASCPQQLGCELKTKRCLPMNASFAPMCCGLPPVGIRPRNAMRRWHVMGCVAQSNEFTAQCTNISDMSVCREQVACLAQEVCKWNI